MYAVYFSVLECICVSECICMRGYGVNGVYGSLWECLGKYMSAHKCISGHMSLCECDEFM